MIADDEFSFETVEVNMKDSTVIMDTIYPLIKDNAIDNIPILIRGINTYIDKHNDSLMIQGPYKTLHFDKKGKDGELIFQVCGITEKEVLNAVDASPVIDKAWKVTNDPFNILLPILIMVYMDYEFKNKSVSEQKSPLRHAIIYFALRHYSSKMLVQFPYGANERIMDYTVNNLSNKFLIKQNQNMYDIIVHLGISNHELVGERLYNTHQDEMVKYYITNMSTKMSSLLKNIKEEYLKSRDDKKYLNMDDDKYEADGKEMREMTNVSSNIMSTANTIYVKMKAAPPNEKFMRYATSRTAVSYSTTSSTLTSILEGETELMKEILTLILQVYFMDQANNTIATRSTHFFKYSMDVYTTSRTNNPSIIRIKAILDGWMQLYNIDYKKFNSETSKINFRKTIYMYIVLYISANS